VKCLEIPAAVLTLQFDQPHLWGVLNAPAAALESSHWFDWCAMIAAFEDSADDVDWTIDDLKPVVDCFRALKRRGVVFDWPVEKALCDLYQKIIGLTA